MEIFFLLLIGESVHHRIGWRDCRRPIQRRDAFLERATGAAVNSTAPIVPTRC